jgi:hypothetical protein
MHTLSKLNIIHDIKSNGYFHAQLYEIKPKFIANSATH